MPVSLRVDAAPAAARPALRELFDDYPDMLDVYKAWRAMLNVMMTRSPV